uniref:PID domain-containing protein n=1 Tax=Clastoptera arizonana TaxID=38151 RepID=A0A1B6DHM6_9HEMI
MTGYTLNPLFIDSDHSTSGFHLQPYKNTYDSNKDTISSSIIFKQRIDAMFNDSCSVISSSRTDIQCSNGYYNDIKARCAQSLVNGNNSQRLLKNNETVDKNIVQNQIDKMFADVEISESIDSKNYKSLIENFSFSVSYLGSLPLNEKVTTLEGLQKPLKSLYFKYKQLVKRNANLKDSLSISKNGLKVLYYSKNDEVITQLNPFHTIAVWAAIKFVCRPRGLGHGREFGLEYAFMPLISDSESSDKVTLFQKVNCNESSYFSEDSCEDQTPLLAIVMRKSGVPRQLECHGFVCKSSEEALVMAANLYKTLLNTMSKNQNRNNKKTKQSRQKNGHSSVSQSIRSSIDGDSEAAGSNIIRSNSIFYRSSRDKAPPIRPPRRNRGNNSGDLIRPGKLTENNFSWNSQNVLESNRTQGEPTGLKRSKSLRQNSNGLEPGDILTKIAIPHSHSFLNAGGPVSSRYSIRSNGSRNILSGKNSLNNPLGLNELFNEFRIQEGLSNIEDILSTIIDSDGMSFNELKPIYKEFLLKLAVTLTKDELYHRSKAIMLRQKNRKKEMARRNSSKLKKTFTAAGGLRKAIRKSIYKLKHPQKVSSNLTNILFHSCGNFQSKSSTLKSNYLSSPFNFSSSVNHKGTNHRLNDAKQGNRIVLEAANQIYLRSLRRINSSKYPSQRKVNTRKNFITRLISDLEYLGPKKCNENRCKLINDENLICHENCNQQQSSEYFTCSDCSHGSGSCTCKSTDKCYCSLAKNTSNEQSKYTSKCENNLSLSSCSCDTDSCIESEKCYCNQDSHPSVFEQLKLQGFAASESSLSRPNSPNTAWQKNESRVKAQKSSKNRLQPSKSLEFLRIERHPSTPTQQPFYNENHHYKRYDTFDSEIEQYDEFSRRRSASVSNQLQTDDESSNSNTFSSQRRSSSSDNLAVDYNMFKKNGTTNAKKNKEIKQEHKVLVVSAHDPKGRVLYMGASNDHPTSNPTTPQQNNNASDVMSVKKSAEIAALFGNTKMQSYSIKDKEDVIYNTLEPPDYLLLKRNLLNNQKRNNGNLENSLGYLP